jgi:act minimal PKS chain-length factor (CLF/KS beta)
MTEPVVVTGLGVIAPTGLGVDRHWTATLAGRNSIRRISRFDPSRYRVRLAGEITDFDPAAHLPSRLLPQTDRMTQLALVATDWALVDSGVDPRLVPPSDMGVVTASASGGFEFGQRQLENLWSRGPQQVSAYQSFAWFYAVNTGQISIRNGMRGPGGVLVTEQAGGLDALAQARRLIRRGTPLVVTGGVDSALCPWAWVAQLTSRRMSPCDDPAAAYLPFDVHASGFVPGEGGAILVVERAEDARRRRAPRVYGEIAGYGATFDPGPGAGAGAEPGLGRAVQIALDDAKITAGDVDAVFADGAGLGELDQIEAGAIASIFGPGKIPVTVPKTMTGRLYSGGAALDLATALLALRHGVVPPTINVTDQHPDCRIDLVTGRPREVSLRSVVVLARGHGGFNAAVVLRAAPDQAADKQRDGRSV